MNINNVESIDTSKLLNLIDAMNAERAAAETQQKKETIEQPVVPPAAPSDQNAFQPLVGRFVNVWA